MVSSLRRLLVGRDRSGPRQYLVVPVALFIAIFTAYALDIFAVSGGVVFLPWDAAVVGCVVAGWVGHRRDGLAFAWLVAYASLLGYHADHALLGLSRRPLAERLAYFVRLDGLAYLAVEALVLGTLAFVVGRLVGRSVAVLRDDGTSFRGR